MLEYQPEIFAHDSQPLGDQFATIRVQIGDGAILIIRAASGGLLLIGPPTLGAVFKGFNLSQHSRQPFGKILLVQGSGSLVSVRRSEVSKRPK